MGAEYLHEFGEYVLQQKKEKDKKRKKLNLRSTVDDYLASHPVKQTLEVGERTEGIATSIHVKCKKHKMLFHTRRQKTKVKLTHRSSNYMTNVMFALAIQSVGGGGY